MNQSNEVVCPHCRTSVQHTDRSQFRLICQSCGRAFMARDWQQVTSDPEPSVVFEPIPVESSKSRSTLNTYFSTLAGQTWPERRLIIRLILISGIICSIAAGFLTEWYRPSDVVFSGIMGILLSSFILFIPEMMVAIGTGAIVMVFCSTVFISTGFILGELFLYFVFGFCLSLVLQLSRINIRKAALQKKDELHSGNSENS